MLSSWYKRLMRSPPYLSTPLRLLPLFALLVDLCFDAGSPTTSFAVWRSDLCCVVSDEAIGFVVLRRFSFLNEPTT
ncbi:hypothetical protein L1987_59757 [Smallanthus sonchifolius]|uniref:Uncharacterized protein n=1 Tax=Smallanthus sonchifolius TaxID=185202 RepID=A0ACB9D700_9ASTR|nr:hypothetical protein L1987_59757 [Smallanthus sonchifolius]